MLAFISVAPSDHWEHMSPYVADSIRIVKESGLAFELGPMGTTIEGEPEEVFELMKRLHINMRGKSKRVSTIIKIDDQVDRPLDRIAAKVKAVREKI